MFKNIYKLPAGHVLTIDSHGTISIDNYWDSVPSKGIDNSQITNLGDEEVEKFYVTGVRERLKKSIAKRMMSDVKMGIFLSGGIDSTMNVSMMKKISTKKLNTFTVGFKDYTHLNEIEYARQIAKEYNTNHHEILISKDDMVRYLDDLIYTQDEPIADWVCIPLYFVSKIAKEQGIKVVQVGEGSDEQFCGYAGYIQYLEMYYKYWIPFKKYFPRVIQVMIAKFANYITKYKKSYRSYADIIDRASRNREPFWSGCSVFWENMKSDILNLNTDWECNLGKEIKKSKLVPKSYLQTDTYNIIASFLNNFDKKYPNRDLLTRMTYNEFKLRLPELLLMRVDKITMSNSIEARVPFLDHDLVDFTMDIPEKWKIKNKKSKYILKKALKGIIPDKIINRKKMGFGAPMSEWLREGFGYEAKNKILNSALLKLNYFKIDEIEEMIDKHIKNKEDNATCIWTILNLCCWYEYWIK